MQKFWRSEWRWQTWGLAYVKGEGVFECCHSGKNGSGVLCLWRMKDQVCLEQNGMEQKPSKTPSSDIHELCESFQKHVYGYELSGLALIAKVRVL